MRSQVFSLSANTSFLRQALPLLVKPYKTILSPTALTSASASQSLLCNIPLLAPVNLFPSSSLRNFTSRATHVNDAGSVDLPLIQSMHNKIKEQLNAESVTVKDVYGDGRHVRRRRAAGRGAGRRKFGRNRSQDRRVGRSGNSIVVVSIDVVSTAFEGQSAVNRQRMVYKAIWEELQSVVHAVDQMTTSTPAEAAARSDRG
ncbi:protein BOLA4, chloroplastic/mitochondrial isoform X1 [Vigna angularis]|uniref:protein BOLA4, chloroplastic/mitochondrial isoform X1 n=1 Tax=Phaseolus angularis TaxID=3914 RepID=UPI0022B3D3A3|nr:protein BOLA4, chloroplastic/mitochondrial isoform X1 [Vigna angularis]